MTTILYGCSILGHYACCFWVRNVLMNYSQSVTRARLTNRQHTVHRNKGASRAKVVCH